MINTNKRIFIYIILFLQICLNIQAQYDGTKVIDNKGTLKYVSKVFSSNATPTPFEDNVEGDIWFDTSATTFDVLSLRREYELKIFDNGSWRKLSENIYNTDGRLTYHRRIIGNGNDLTFENINQYRLNSRRINFNSWILPITLNPLQYNNPSADPINYGIIAEGPFWGKKAYRDSNGDVGSSGQILSSISLGTEQGTDWIDAPITATGTEGSVFFANTDGTVTEDNDHFFWDKANERLYIGAKLTGTNKLNVSGTTRTQGVSNSNGTANRPSYRFTSDSNTGMFRGSTSDYLRFATGGQEAISISDTQTVSINKDLWVKGKFIDSSGDVGLKGQVLTSIGTGTDWKYVEKPTIILNRNFNGSNILQGSNNIYSYFPLNSSHILVNNSDFFEVVNDGRIRIKVSGNYLLSAELSTSNMPSGNTKYIVATFLNGTANPGNIMGYLSRGFVSLNSIDWWGTTGTLMYPLSANDIVHFRYVINNGGSNLNARFLNISITKL